MPSRYILVEWDGPEYMARNRIELACDGLMDWLCRRRGVKNPAISTGPGEEALINPRKTKWVVCTKHGIMAQGHCQITDCTEPYEVLYAVPGS